MDTHGKTQGKTIICSYINNPGPMVVFATPGMLHGGLSLTIFEEWCTGAEVATYNMRLLLLFLP